jgi:hypothetical protein
MNQVTNVADLDDNEVERDRPLNPYRCAASESAEAIVKEAVGLVQRYEARFKLRRNKRRSKDQAIFEQTVDAVLSDLMHRHLVGGGGIFVSRSNQLLGTKNRYRPPIYGKAFRGILDLLEKPEMDYVKQDVAPDVQGVRRSTVLRPGQRLLDRMAQHEIEVDDLHERPSGETIILKRSKDPDDYWDQGERIDYPDDEMTVRFRAELEEVNQWLENADLTFSWIGLEWPHTSFDPRDRRLRRVFTRGRFDSGGRLFGGFWQLLRKAERRSGLCISGEKAVELDYGQAGVRILYGMAGKRPAAGDLYDMPATHCSGTASRR